MRFSGGSYGFLSQCGASDDATCYLWICLRLPTTLAEHLPSDLLPLALDIGPRQWNPEHLGYVSHGEVVGDQVDLVPILREVESEGEERHICLRQGVGIACLGRHRLHLLERFHRRLGDLHPRV